ncbi:MAG TPA: transposase [Steroidobacteraceae bacterium]
MPRPPRLHVPGASYHVVLRGNHQESLFGSATDRRVLNDIVAEVLAQYDCRIHAFCWMTSHLHALVQIADRPLGTVMQRVAIRYSRYRHKSLDTSGHLFERRHKAKLVDVDAYFLTLLRYIHLNPVKAGIVNDPVDYPWSSHRAFLGAESISWLTTDFGLSLFSSDLVQARAAYKRFILEPCKGEDEDLENESHPDDSRILGTDQFVARIPATPYKPRSTLTLDQLAESLCAEHHINAQLLRSPSRARRLASIRANFSAQAIEQRIATLCEVARFLGRDPSSLARLLARHESKRERE